LVAGVDPYIEREADPLTPEPGQPFGHLFGTLDSGTSNDYSFHTVAEEVVNDRGRTNSTAHLKLHRLLRSQRDNHRAIGQNAVLGAIQVHNMQPGGAEFAVAQQQLVRLVLIAGLGAKIALKEPHTASVAQVDRRNQQHQFSLRKFASKRAPVAA